MQEIEMGKIEMTLPEIASYMDKIFIFIPDGYEYIHKLVDEAFTLDCIPEDEILEMTSTAETLEDCIDEYWLPGISGTQKDKAVIRKMIELCKEKSDLLLIFMEIIKNINPESFEFLLFLRRAAEIL